MENKKILVGWGLEIECTDERFEEEKKALEKQRYRAISLEENAGLIEKGIENRTNGLIEVIYLAQISKQEPLYLENCIERTFFGKKKTPMNLFVYDGLLIGFDRKIDDYDNLVFHIGDIETRIKKGDIKIICTGNGRKVFSSEYFGSAKDFLDKAAYEGKRRQKEIFERYLGGKNGRG